MRPLRDRAFNYRLPALARAQVRHDDVHQQQADGQDTPTGPVLDHRRTRKRIDGDLPVPPGDGDHARGAEFPGEPAQRVEVRSFRVEHAFGGRSIQVTDDNAEAARRSARPHDLLDDVLQPKYAQNDAGEGVAAFLLVREMRTLLVYRTEDEDAVLIGRLLHQRDSA